MPLKPIRKREFPMYYAPGKRLFQIVVRISDAPGSLSSILNLLGSRVNLIGTATYTLGDGTAMLNAFAEALTAQDTTASIKKALSTSPATVESEVREGKDGLLVDTFHTGLEALGEDYMLLRRWGMGNMFDHIVKIFGTGGEVLLYEEGSAMARGNLERTSSALTMPTILGNPSYLISFLSAQGWGSFKLDQVKDEATVTAADCFECAKGSKVRRKCDFVRGYLEGTASGAGGEYQAEEVECRLRGGKACVFHIFPRKQK